MINGQPSSLVKAKRGLQQGDPIFHLLFVLVMEYLHMMLQDLGRNPDFNFHLKCDKMKIDDLALLVFTRGDLSFLQLLMRRFLVLYSVLSHLNI